MSSSETLGQLEESLLIIVMSAQESYGVSVARDYEKHTGKSISIPAAHTVLKRLERKGLLKSKMGDTTPERGGRRKRLFEATPYAYKLIVQMRDTRMHLWSLVPNLDL